jgi:hypothetical protein
MSTTLVWATVHGDRWPNDGTDPTLGLNRDLPGPGETRLVVVQFPPDSVFGDERFDAAAAAAEQRRVSPDLASTFEAAAPGMHTTDTIDYAIVLSGVIQLDLDRGVLVQIGQGETVIQNGTRHAWRNNGDAPAVVAFINIGPPVTR